MYIEVKNLKGTSDNYPPGFSSWKDFWEQQTGRKFTKCSCTICTEKAILGGHVIRTTGSRNWYIVPLCQRCNHREDSFSVSQADLVPVR